MSSLRSLTFGLKKADMSTGSDMKGMWRNLIYSAEFDKFVDLVIYETTEVGSFNVDGQFDDTLANLIRQYCTREGVVLGPALDTGNGRMVMPPLLNDLVSVVKERFTVHHKLNHPLIQCEVLRKQVVRQDLKIQQLETRMFVLEEALRVLLSTGGTPVAPVKLEKQEQN